MTRTHVDKQIVMYFSFGALLGGILASFIVVQLPLVFIQFAVSGFILFMVWGKKPKAHELSPIGRSIAGFITTILSMFVGATGPLVAAFVHRSVADKMRTETVHFPPFPHRTPNPSKLVNKNAEKMQRRGRMAPK